MSEDTIARPRAAEEQAKRLGWVALALLLICLIVAADFLGAIVFASWTVTTFYPVYRRLAGKLRATWAGLALTAAIIVVILAPLVFVGILLTSRSIELASQGIQLWQTGGPYHAVAALMGQDGATPKISDLYREAVRAAPGLVAGASRVFLVLSQLVVKTFLFVVFIYGLFVNGGAVAEWVRRRSPLGETATSKLMRIYCDTGRGILVGVFLVVILHGIVATAGYAIVGIGRPFELGAMTAMAGLLPAIGTGLVWVPLAAVLALTGHLGQGLGVVVVGIIVGSVDNVMRPWLSRLGRVPLPTLVLFVAFFSGLAAFGAAGVLLGPLLFAWGKGAADLYAEARDARGPEAEPPVS